MAEAAKVIIYGMAGYGIRWGLGRFAGKAADIRTTLTLIENMGREGEAVIRTIALGAPDISRAALVMSDRQTLIDRLQRTVGRDPSFDSLKIAHRSFVRALRPADPHFGGAAGEDEAQAVRVAETALRNRYIEMCERDWAWRLYGHERK